MLGLLTTIKNKIKSIIMYMKKIEIDVVLEPDKGVVEYILDIHTSKKESIRDYGRYQLKLPFQYINWALIRAAKRKGNLSPVLIGYHYQPLLTYDLYKIFVTEVFRAYNIKEFAWQGK